MSTGRALQGATGVGSLTLVYALALGSFQALDLLIGAVAGTAVLVALRRHLFPRPCARPAALASRALRLLPFVVVVAREVFLGTVRVAIATLRRDPAPHGGLVVVPMGERSDFGVAVSALAISLTPGELVVDFDWERRLILVHALDGADPDRLRAEQQCLYERYQRAVFP